MMKITYPVAMEKWGYENLDQFRIMNLDFHLRRKPFSKTSLARIAGSVKIVHGTEDVAYPQSYSREFLRRLEEAGVEASMHVVRGAPHYLSPDFSNQWVLSHSMATRSPILRLRFGETFGPIAVMIPAASWPRTRGS